MTAAALGLALGMPGALAQSATPSAAPASQPQWRPWAELGGYYGSDDSSRGEAVLWAPLWQSSTALFFTDLRGKLFEEEQREGNFALGYRKMLPSGWNLGLWGGYDIRESGTDTIFHQASFGVEALSARWDLRVNGYVALSDPEGSPSLAEVQLSGNQIFMVGGQEVPLYGLDGEVGYRLLASPETASGRRHEFRVYGGGFWYDAKEALEEVAGPKLRLEYRVEDVVARLPGSRLSIEGEFSHDDVRDDKWEVGARLRIPFGGGARYAALSPQARRMAEGLERDTDIVTAQSAAEPVTDVATNVALNQVAYVNDGGDISATSTAAGGNSLIIANGTINGPQQLQGSQSLQGGGSTIQVRGQKSGVVASFTAPGATPTLVNPGNNPNLTLLGRNTHVAGLNIQGGGVLNGNNHGIFGGSNKRNIFIDQMSIADVGGNGIAFDNDNSNVTITGTSVTDAGLDGIFFFDNNTDVTIAGATIANAGLDGIGFESGNSNVTIANTTITDAADTGILFFTNNSNVTITGTSIANAVDNSIDFSSNNSNVTIVGATITDAGGDGIQFGSFNQSFTIADTTIANAGDEGIDFVNNNTVTIAGTGIANASGEGIEFDDDNTVTITDTLIQDSQDNGILAVSNNVVTIARTSINDTGASGISLAFGNNLTIADSSIARATTYGITFESANTVSIARTSIADAGAIGLFFEVNNGVTLADSTLAGTFGDDGINISGAGNTLGGAGNTAAGATFGDQFCDAAAGQAGQLIFDIGNCPP